MRKPLVASLFALVITGAGAAPAIAAPEPAAAPVKAVVGSVVDTANRTLADVAAPAVQAVNFAYTVRSATVPARSSGCPPPRTTTRRW